MERAAEGKVWVGETGDGRGGGGGVRGGMVGGRIFLKGGRDRVKTAQEKREGGTPQSCVGGEGRRKG